MILHVNYFDWTLLIKTLSNIWPVLIFLLTQNVLLSYQQTLSSVSLANQDKVKRDNSKLLKWEWNPPDVEHRRRMSQNREDLVRPEEMELEGVPKFIRHPNPLYYTMKSHPAKVECVAEPVSHVSIFCVDKDYPYMPDNPKNVITVEKLDSHDKPNPNGERWKFSMLIKTKDVEEWFGDYQCHCTAWNRVSVLSRPKKVLSERTLIREAYLDKEFLQVPVGVVTEVGKSVQLYCNPPKGLPLPEVYWQKNGEPLDLRDGNIAVNDFKHLIIHKAQVEDSGNYTCVATSSFGMERKSASAEVKVFLNGGWSSWSSWSLCDPKLCVQLRTRKCDSSASNMNGKLCSNSPFAAVERRNCSDAEICTGSIYETTGSAKRLPSSNGDSYGNRHANSVGMYLGLFVAVVIFLCLLIVTILLIRRKTILHAPGVLRYTGSSLCHHEKNVKKVNDFLLSPELMTQTVVTIKNPNASESLTSSLLNQKRSLTSSDAIIANNGGYMSPVPIIPPYSNINGSGNGISMGSPHMGALCLPPAPSSTYTTIDRAGEIISPSSNTRLISPPLPSTLGVWSNSGIQPPSSKHLPNPPPPPLPLPHHHHQQQHSLPAKEFYHPHPSVSHSSCSNSVSDSAMTSARSNYPTPTAGGSLSALYHELSLNSNTAQAMANFIPSNLDVDSVAWGTITQVGGRLCLPDAGISLTIPMGAIPQGRNEEMYLAVCRDPKDQPAMTSDHQTILSPVVMCGPTTVSSLTKSVILSFQHCANLAPAGGGWNLKLLQCSSSNENENIWEEVVSIVQETSSPSTSVHCQVDSNMVHVMSQKMGRYCLLGASASSTIEKAGKLLRLAAFGGPYSRTSELTIRVYVLADTRDAFDNVLNLENRLGGHLLDTPKQMLFRDNGHSMCFCIEELSLGWRSRLQNKYQEIAFKHVWSGTQDGLLNCSFVLENVDPTRQTVSCKILSYQEQCYVGRQVLQILCDKTETFPNLLTRSITEQPFRKDRLAIHPDPLQSVFRISPSLRMKLSFILDPLHPRGHDWRMLAHALGIDKNLQYFSSKSSPTDSVLDMWEARNRDETSVHELRSCLLALNRVEINGVFEVEPSLLRL